MDASSEGASPVSTEISKMGQNPEKVIVLPKAAFSAVQEMRSNQELQFASVDADRGTVLGTGANPGVAVSRMPSPAAGVQLRS